jgi:hypothetical protein
VKLGDEPNATYRDNAVQKILQSETERIKIQFNIEIVKRGVSGITTVSLMFAERDWTNHH